LYSVYCVTADNMPVGTHVVLDVIKKVVTLTLFALLLTESSRKSQEQ